MVANGRGVPLALVGGLNRRPESPRVGGWWSRGPRTLLRILKAGARWRSLPAPAGTCIALERLPLQTASLLSVAGPVLAEGARRRTRPSGSVLGASRCTAPTRSRVITATARRGRQFPLE